MLLVCLFFYMLVGVPLMYDLRAGDLADAAVQELLRLHFEEMRGNSPLDKCHVLDVFGLQASEINVYAAWYDGNLASIGALKLLNAQHGEIKSMRAHPAYRGRGAGSAMLRHIIAEARKFGLERLSLETGSGMTFDAALALYRRYGFRDGPPFGDYRESDFNQFLHLKL